MSRLPFDIRLVILSVSMFFTFSSQAENTITYKVTELVKDFYMLEGDGGFAGGNIVISKGEDGLVMIDDGINPVLKNLKSAIAGISDKPVDFLINTHVHGDHTGNNSAFAELGTHIVAHENLRKHLKTHGYGKNKPAADSALPVLTFADRVTFHLNNNEAEVFHVARAHTDGDSVIHFKNLNIIHTGDILFNGMFPFIDLNSGGSVSGYIAAQKRIFTIADSKTKIVPGHGPLGTKADLKASFTMLEDARSKVKALKDKGKSEDQVVAAEPLKGYHNDWNWGFITTEKMTRTLYQDLKAQ